MTDLAGLLQWRSGQGFGGSRGARTFVILIPRHFDNSLPREQAAFNHRLQRSSPKPAVSEWKLYAADKLPGAGATALRALGAVAVFDPPSGTLDCFLLSICILFAAQPELLRQAMRNAGDWKLGPDAKAACHQIESALTTLSTLDGLTDAVQVRVWESKPHATRLRCASLFIDSKARSIH